ncbi:MAG: sigma-70 family RNA polymerase sigma factor [Verrucomicrobiota bacterium]
MKTKEIRKKKLFGGDDRAIEEVRWMAGVASGDRESFRKLHERYAGLVYATVFKVLNDHEDAEDVSQVVFTQVWQKAHLYDEAKGKPITWTVTLARNRAIDRLRSKQRRSHLRDGFSEETKVFEETATRRDASDEASERERAATVRGAVLELSDEQREAIELAYFAGLTQQEIARKLGQPLGTVKARIRRGVMRLRGVVGNRL